MFTFLKENKLLYFFLAFYFFVGGILLSQIDKGDIVLWFNKNHSPFLDFFFENLTYIGEATVLVPVLIIFLIFNRYIALIYFVNYAINGIIIQILKKIVFEDMLRPYLFFKDQGHIMDFYHFVEGVTIRKHFTFPSGHTNSAFAFLILMAFLVKNDVVKISLAILAIMVGFSRVYLFQHFFIDTFVGAILAIILSTLFYYFFENKTNLKNNKYLKRI